MASATPPPHYRIAIIGGGPSGCILARLLQRMDVKVTIFESEAAPNVRNQGGTLDLHDESGLLALKEAGLYDDFLRLARFDGDGLSVCDKKLLCYLNLKPTKDDSWFSTSQGKPEIDRADLRQLLYDCLPDDTIRWGCRMRSINSNDLSLNFDHGVERGFDLVVGAEGAWSKTRTVLTPGKPFFSGVGGHNLIIPDAAKRFPDLDKLVNRGSIFSFSDGSVVMGQQMGDKSIYVSVWGVRSEKWMEEADYDVHDGKQVKAALAKTYSNWEPKVQKLMQVADDDSVISRSLFMLPVGFRWDNKPGVTLIGDSAHLMTPFIGEGVNTAMRDAVEMANAIEAAIKDSGSKATLNRRIKQYEEEMFARVTPITQKTEDMMKLMLFTPGAPRTVMERWCIRALQDELNSFVLVLFKLYVHINFFFFRLFW
ncbi:peptide transporter ptr2 [Lecanora helva]